MPEFKVGVPEAPSKRTNEDKDYPAVFNKLSKSGGSALVMVKISKFEMGARPVYLPSSAVAEELGVEVEDLTEDMKGAKFNLEGGFRFIDIIDSESGDVRCTQPKEGEPVNLKQLSWS